MGKLKNLYKEIWEERPHICEHCGVYIPRPIIHNFAHIRSKGARPDLKHDKDNIRLLCSEWNRPDGLVGCHTLEHTNPEKFKERGLKMKQRTRHGNVTYKGDKSQLEIIRSILQSKRVVTEKDVKPYKIGRDSFASCISRLRDTMNIEADHIERERKPFTTSKSILRYRI